MEAQRTSRRSAAIAAILMLTAKAGHAYAEQPSPLIAAIQAAGKAQVAIASAPPYAYMSPNGDPQGYLIDLSKAVLQGLEVEGLAATVTTWDAMIPGLNAKQFDFIPAGLNITKARCEVVLFTAPVTAQQDALYVKPGNPKQLQGYTSVAGKGDVTLAVLSGSSQEAFARQSGIQRRQLVIVPDIQAGVAAVLGGRADAFAVGEFSVPKPEQRGVERIADPASPLVGIGIVFRKSDMQARDAFDAELAKLRANGTMQKLYAGKYGFTNWEVLAGLSKASDLAPGCE
ncbi:ectoine/hydroxyectoine ABC transporter substrate-binding protein EhuB [Rhodoligotrophos defluvii]|uniref:ectoine/hydroxyectoine ABC transporter substrate-binding protein EhuB n=1 Tax=Rhodoligotrophos defluvii TaxID=2561934 RepID=UPI001484F961|nr:ectoine/hydroxyectoine ABC transporter substrate-binding protein EhuB [Rhodoligotrophos defluvii]